MRDICKCLTILLFLFICSQQAHSQKDQPAVDAITASDLESYVSFLASPLLKGRMNGSREMEIAAEYIVSQAKILGLKPGKGDSYYQPYNVNEKLIDQEKTRFSIISGNDSVALSTPIFQLLPQGPSDFTIGGEVVFAGYGIKNDKYGYNDFSGINTDNKIILLMNRAPSNEDGTKFLMEGADWSNFRNIESKLPNLMYSRAKAILIVMDPKSGNKSFDQQYPGISGQLASTLSLIGEKSIIMDFPGMPRIMYVHREVADKLLEGTGKSLQDIQKEIDSEMKPQSFEIPGKYVRLNEVSVTKTRVFRNVVAMVEGKDNNLKDECIIFSSHYDHIGEAGGAINPGADDDASGCAALLSIAEAFGKQQPLRTVLFLWVSGEELGLFGSKSYVKDPAFPLKNTVADLNMDMIGRIKSPADSTDENPMTGPNSVFVITGNQSKDLIDIANDIDRKSPIDFDYSLSGRNHPLQLFRRSDHFNFVKNDIPVLFFTTGLHADYHSPADVVEKLDFKKMELVTRTMFEIGFTVANRKQRIKVNNPYSSWGKR
jgi:hypothetical protein